MIGQYLSNTNEIGTIHILQVNKAVVTKYLIDSAHSEHQTLVIDRTQKSKPICSLLSFRLYGLHVLACVHIGPCLVHPKRQIFFKIPHHIKSYTTCMEY